MVWKPLLMHLRILQVHPQGHFIKTQNDKLSLSQQLNDAIIEIQKIWEGIFLNSGESIPQLRREYQWVLCLSGDFIIKLLDGSS